MGLLSGSRKTTATETNTDSFNTTNTTTTTQTETVSTVRDIGFTGQQALELAAITAAGGASASGQSFDTVRQISNDASENFNTLVGGSSDLVDATRSVLTGVSDDATSTLETISGDLTSTVLGVSYDAGAIGRRGLETVESISLDASSNTNTLIDGVIQSSANLVEGARAATQKALNTAAETVTGAQSGPSAQLVRQLPIIIGIAVLGFWAMRRR